MQIVKSLSPRNSDRSYSACIRVEAGEAADCEAMLRLLDGEIGHFGFSCSLVSIGKEPEYKASLYGGKPIGAGYLTAESQFGFPPAGEAAKMVRYYSASVNRD